VILPRKGLYQPRNLTEQATDIDYLTTAEKRRVIEFLQHSLQRLDSRLMVVWDGAKIHRSRMVWDFVREHKGDDSGWSSCAPMLRS
jgi:hypothetical protein